MSVEISEEDKNSFVTSTQVQQLTSNIGFTNLANWFPPLSDGQSQEGSCLIIMLYLKKQPTVV